MNMLEKDRRILTDFRIKILKKDARKIKKDFKNQISPVDIARGKGIDCAIRMGSIMANPYPNGHRHDAFVKGYLDVFSD